MPYTDKEAQKASARKHYLANKDTMVERATKARTKHRKTFQEWMRSLKEEEPCMDCGQHWPYYVMQFDHRPGTTKMFHIGSAFGHAIADVLAEIQKCDLVCANCHAIRTHERRISSGI